MPVNRTSIVSKELRDFTFCFKGKLRVKPYEYQCTGCILLLTDKVYIFDLLPIKVMSSSFFKKVFECHDQFVKMWYEQCKWQWIVRATGFPIISLTWLNVSIRKVFCEQSTVVSYCGVAGRNENREFRFSPKSLYIFLPWREAKVAPALKSKLHTRIQIDWVTECTITSDFVKCHYIFASTPEITPNGFVLC